MLKDLDLEKMQADLRAEIDATNSEIKKKKAAKRLKLIEVVPRSPATSRNG